MTDPAASRAGLPAAADDPETPLLAADEPPPYRLSGADRPRRDLLVLCDHATNRIPRCYGDLGMRPEHLGDHIAHDIGAADVAEALAERLDCLAIFNAYSRVVIDPNRYLDDPSSIPRVSDNIVIPGNQGVGEVEARQRAASLFWPYQNRIAEEIAARRRPQREPVLISVHSFTPEMAGQKRPWHVGVLSDRDRRLADPLIAALRRQPNLVVGDNQPYNATEPLGFTVDHHATKPGLPHVLLEIRQDLIEDPRRAAAMGGLLADVLLPILADDAQFSLLNTSE